MQADRKNVVVNKRTHAELHRLSYENQMSKKEFIEYLIQKFLETKAKK